MAEFSSEVRIDDIVVRDSQTSSAVDDPIRATILDMLADEPMTVAEIHQGLSDRGHERSKNTVRHHVNRLRDAGLIEVARLEEGRGGTKKYYKANTIVLSYTLPEESEDEIDSVIEDIRPEVRRVLDELEDEYGDTVGEIADMMTPCEHCANQKYREYILLTLLRKAFVREYQETR